MIWYIAAAGRYLPVTIEVVGSSREAAHYEIVKCALVDPHFYIYTFRVYTVCSTHIHCILYPIHYSLHSDMLYTMDKYTEVDFVGNDEWWADEEKRFADYIHNIAAAAAH